MNNFLLYLFSPAPGAKFSFYVAFIVILAILAIAAIASKILIKKHKNPAFKRNFKDVPMNLVYFTLIIGFLIFTRFENIAFFSMRFMLYLTLVIFLYWTGKQIHVFFKKYKKESEEIKKAMETPKYTTKKRK